MDNSQHNSLVNFIWGIADDVLRDVYVRGKYRDVIPWEDKDRIICVITEELPEKVNADEAYSNAKANSDKQNARIEHDKALGRAILELMTDHTELFKQFTDNPGFKKSLSDAIFALTYSDAASAQQKA